MLGNSDEFRGLPKKTQTEIVDNLRDISKSPTEARQQLRHDLEAKLEQRRQQIHGVRREVKIVVKVKVKAVI